MIPLRRELVEQCGFQYDAKDDRYFRPSGIINLRVYRRQWWAFLHFSDRPDAMLCQIKSLGHLMQLVIAIEGDQNAIKLTNP